MPTVLFNVALNLLPDAGLTVRGPDTLGAVMPMFNEERGAPRALASLLDQDQRLDELVISINGGSDRTSLVVRSVLFERGFESLHESELLDHRAKVERWSCAGSSTRVALIDHATPVSKADSVNLAVASELVGAHRVLVVDGDTVFDPGFVRALKDNFYRLRFERLGRDAAGRPRYGYVLEDIALQSGAVRSLPAQSGLRQAAFISAGRDAEYAFSSVLRSGQCATTTSGRALRRSRLFTVVGCGFAARRESFPMPNDTQTEDHDFTLATQNECDTEVGSDPATLDARGFRVKVGGRERSLRAYLGPNTPLVVRKGASARFVGSAVMYTEDPPRVSGFLRQVERWNGGALENALKRLAAPGERSAQRPNVLFALWTAQVENMFGLALMALLPILLGLQYGLPGARTPAASLVSWLTLDLLVSAAIVYAGAVRLGAAAGKSGARLHWSALRLTGRGIVPLLVLRSLGALSYLTAASRVVPAYLRARSAKESLLRSAQFAGQAVQPREGRDTVIWDRPAARVRPAVHARIATVAASLAVASMGLFGGVAYLTRPAYDTNDRAWHHTYAAPRLDQDDHEVLPVRAIAEPEPRLTHISAVTSVDQAAAAGASAVASEGRGPSPDGLSPFCAPESVAGAAANERLLAPASGSPATVESSQRTPLSPWGLLVLARLVPLLSHLEEASTAYDLDAAFLLRVLLNESYLDPLARGPTGDLGLAQVTTDALTLLRSVSAENGSALENEQLFAGDFSVYDPEFSLCAGAAKLAWAAAQPFGDDERVAYALYINPLHGASGGRVADTHLEPVAAMAELAPLVELLAGTLAAYRADGGNVSPDERALLDIAAAVAAADLDVPDAYAAVARLLPALRIDDRQFYRAIMERLYDTEVAAAAITWPPAATALAHP